MTTLNNTKPGRNIQILLILRSSGIRCLGSTLRWATWERILITVLRRTELSRRIFPTILNLCSSLETAVSVRIYITWPLHVLIRLIIYDFDLSYLLLFSHEVKPTIVVLQSTFKKDKSATINNWQFIRIYERTRSDLRIREIYIKIKIKKMSSRTKKRVKKNNDLLWKESKPLMQNAPSVSY